MWVLEGTRKWLKEGLSRPPAVVFASETYFSNQDPLGEWLEANCEIDPQNRDGPAQLHFDYKAFCEREGYTSLGRRRFGDELEKRGYHRGLKRRSQ